MRKRLLFPLFVTSLPGCPQASFSRTPHRVAAGFAGLTAQVAGRAGGSAVVSGSAGPGARV